jgi:hypothetical protein
MAEDHRTTQLQLARLAWWQQRSAPVDDTHLKPCNGYPNTRKLPARVPDWKLTRIHSTGTRLGHTKRPPHCRLNKTKLREKILEQATALDHIGLSARDKVPQAEQIALQHLPPGGTRSRRLERRLDLPQYQVWCESHGHPVVIDKAQKSKGLRQ